MRDKRRVVIHAWLQVSNRGQALTHIKETKSADINFHVTSFTGEKSENNSSPAEDKLLKLIDTSLPVAQVAGILPGIGSYNEDTSDSNSSSAESDIEDYIKTKKTVIRVHVQQT